MNYGAIKIADCANGFGCRTSFFVSGCRHHCKGCFQPETWDFNFGKKYDKETEDFLVASVSASYVDGLTILGGEPMEPENQKELLPLIQRIKKIPGKTIWIYSGYTWEELNDKTMHCHTDVTDAILSEIDVLVDGEFHEDEKDISLVFRGSRNQRIIDIKETKLRKEIVTLFNS